MYRLPHLCKHSQAQGVVEVLSSQDSDVAPLGKSKFVEHFDNSICKLVRDFADGTRQEAFMTPGPNGLAFAQFEGEEPKMTECPNLLIQSPRCKRPAASTKRPAAALLPAVSSGESDSDRHEASAQVEEPTLVEQKHNSGKIQKHLLYSKTYHRSKKANLNIGMSDEDAKVAARKAANDAVAAARAAGILEDSKS
jgi:hypothetical protein